MKRKLFPALAITTMMMAASCSQDDLVDNVASGKEVDVTFTANLEGMAETRAISDGLTVDQLIFEVYDENGNRIDALRQEDIAVANHAATVNVRLVKGQTYQFVFWAQKEGQTYYDVTDLKEIEVLNYTSDANDEKRDAFYWYEPATPVTGSFSKNITLYRPFAQLNLGTTVEDIAAAEKAGVSIAQSTVTVTGAVYSKLNTFNKEVSEPVEATFALANIPANSEDLIIRDDLNQFENDYYKYLSTNYLLAPLAGELSTQLVFDLVDDKGQQINELTVTNAPLQRNWRTNIVGDILTGEGTFNIVIDPIYDGDYNYEMDGTWLDIWDGTSKEPVEVNGVYEIASASNLVWMSEQPEGTYNGKSFKLTKDISFKNVDAPEGSNVDNNGDTTPATIKPLFKGMARNINFNGNNHVIRDFIIEGETESDMASLFGCMVGGSINNLTVINADVTGAELADAYAGIVIAKTFGTVTLDNVVVKDSKLKGTQKIGALIGFVAENQVNVLNCRVEGVEISNHDIAGESGSTGGLIGCIAHDGHSYIENSWVKNSIINAIQAKDEDKRANSQFIGVIRGTATVTIKNSGVDGNTFNNSIAWTPFYDPFIGGRDDSAVLIVDGDNKAYQGSYVEITSGSLYFEKSGTYGSVDDYACIARNTGTELTINADIVSEGGGVGAVDGAEVTFNGGTLAVNSTSTSGRYLFYAEGEGTVITINGGEFSFSKTLNQKRAYIYAGAGTTVYVKGGTFGKASTRSGYTAGIMGSGTVIITGGTFGFNPSAWVAAGYQAVENAGVWTVSAN